MSAVGKFSAHALLYLVIAGTSHAQPGGIITNTVDPSVVGALSSLLVPGTPPPTDVPNPAPVDSKSIRNFVNQAYFDLLGRVPTNSDLITWGQVVANYGKSEFAKRIMSTTEYRTIRTKEIFTWAFKRQATDADAQPHVDNWNNQNLEIFQIRLGFLGCNLYQEVAASAALVATAYIYQPFLDQLYRDTVSLPCPADVLPVHDANLLRNPDKNPLITALLKSKESYASLLVPQTYDFFLRRKANEKEIDIHATNLSLMPDHQEELFIQNTILPCQEYQDLCNQRGFDQPPVPTGAPVPAAAPGN